MLNTMSGVSLEQPLEANTTRALATIAGLQLVRPPEELLAEARKAADCLMKLVEEKKLYVVLNRKKHLFVEAWETLAHFFGVCARIRQTEQIEVLGVAAYKATADCVLISTGEVISSADAICSTNEENWSTRPKYERDEATGDRIQVGEVAVPQFQVLSMAQTRAIGKVLRNVLAWVVVLTGYAPTPAEEMDRRQAKSERQMPQAKQAEGPKRVTEPQRKRMFAIAREGGVSNDQIMTILGAHGFSNSGEVTVESYEAIVSEIQAQSKAHKEAQGEEKLPF